ncbi:hypothetical protein L6V77_05530 [Myxococcota bacterium]|nr:hypothetical protein [Myxococcota bacterium]
MKTTRMTAALLASAVAACNAPAENTASADGEKALTLDQARDVAHFHRSIGLDNPRAVPRVRIENLGLDLDRDLGETDIDGDGIPMNRDLCPGTAPGTPANERGCAAAQHDPVAAREAAASVGEPLPLPADGPSEVRGFTTLVVDRASNNPLVFWIRDELVTALEDGFVVQGSLDLELPGGQMLTFAEASLVFERTANGDIDRVHGTARLPFPGAGLMEGVELADLAQVQVGYDYGRNLQDLDAPVLDDRRYLFFSFSTGLEASAGPVTLSAPNGQSVTLVLDPADPMIYFRGNLGGVSGIGPVEDMGIGLSWQGRIPFEPHNTFGMDAEDAAGFQGNLYLAGSVSLRRIPLSIDGEIVLDIDPLGNGRSMADLGADDLGFQYGANGTLNLAADFSVVSFEMELARSSTIYHASREGAYAVISGQVSPDLDWLPEGMPIRAEQALEVAGKISTDSEESYLRMHGDYSLDLSGLGALSGLDLSELFMADATIEVDRDGFHLAGVTRTQITPLIGLNGEATVTADLGADMDDWRVTIDGHLVIDGIDLSADAHAELTTEGLYVNGVFVTPISRIDLLGRIDGTGVALDGRASIEIPIVAGREVAQWVTDAAVCGYETVTDGAVCGYKTVRDATLCGADWVVDGAVCGSRIVTDGAICGWSYVTDGARCGFSYVTDGARCGWDAVASWFCDTFDVCDYEARSCNVANSCNIANTCSVDLGCNVARTCEIEDTCDRVATCEQRVTVPDFNYGTVRGEANLHLGNDGLAVSVDADYCVTDGACTPIGGGRLDLSSTPEVCVTVPGLDPEFCGRF